MKIYQDHSQLFRKNSIFFLELLFLLIIFIFILIIGLQITPGITPDSVLKYLPISENIFNRGIEWLLYNGSYETTVIPPLYEFITAFVMAFGLGVVQASGLVSLISFAFLPIPLYYLGKQIGGIRIGFLTVILCCTMKPFWDNGTSSMTDMLFLFLTISSLCFFSRYIVNKHSIDLIFSSFILVLANWTRWLGIALLLTYILILICYNFKKDINIQETAFFLLLSIPLISILYLRNFFLIGEIYLSEKIPFSVPNGIINFGMIGLNILWDFLGFNSLKTLNQTLMDFYFNSLSNTLPLDYLLLFKSLHIDILQVISLIIGLILTFLLLLLIFLYFYKPLLTNVFSIINKKPWIILFIIFIFFYIGMFLYIECTARLTLMDSRYLLPIYPLFIIFGIKGLFFFSRVEPPFQRLCHILLITSILIFIIWQSFITGIYISHVQQGRDFSDPALMEGPAFQWIKKQINLPTPIVINDGLRGYFWEKSLNQSIIRIPNRYYPINTFLMEQPVGTYLVITPVIGTKGPYRWSDIKPYIINSSRYIQILDQDEDKIFQIVG